jgi:hypothetical protein
MRQELRYHVSLSGRYSVPGSEEEGGSKEGNG